MTINKRDLIRECATYLGYSQKCVSEILDWMYEYQKECLLNGNNVYFTELYNIKPIVKKGKRYKHPITGEYAYGQDKKTLHITPTPSFNKLLNNNQTSIESV